MKIVTLSQLGKGKDSLVSRNVWIPAARPAPMNSKSVYNQHQYAPGGSVIIIIIIIIIIIMICTRRAGKLNRARSQLYRSQILQKSMR